MDTKMDKQRTKKQTVCRNAIRAGFGCEKRPKLGARTMNLCGLYSVLARLALLVKDRFLDQNIYQKVSFWDQFWLKKVLKTTPKMECGKEGAFGPPLGALWGALGDPLWIRWRSTGQYQETGGARGGVGKGINPLPRDMGCRKKGRTEEGHLLDAWPRGPGPADFEAHLLA